MLYLNFSGMTVVNTEWNVSEGRTEIPAVAFSTDADLATFSDAEQAAIKRIWQRVAEDYAPFNIDVTTEPPGTLGTRTAVALITRTTDANGAPNPSDNAGGVAYVNVFGTTSFAKYRPAWIYHDNLSNDESFIAEAASHEVGHNMGLSHDGRSDGADYYGGHGSGDTSWGPLMGTGYNRNVSQWSKGDYYLASNTQDDLTTVAGKLTYRSDDHGNTPGAATALSTRGTNIVATTPENDPRNTNTLNKGVIERTADIDVFSFVTGTGPVRLAVNPWIMPAGTKGGNTDLIAQLYNESGALLLANNPASQTTALLQTNLTQGRYFLHVRNSGAGDPFSSTPSGYTVYGSVGQYFISGYIAAVSNLFIAPTAELQAADLTQSGQVIKEIRVTYSDDLAIDVSSIDVNDLRITGPSGYDRMPQTVTLDSSSDGTPRTATYAFTSGSGGAWSADDNGTYTVWMRTNEVADTQGGWVAARQLGQFQVAVPVPIYAASMDVDPGWILEPDWQYGAPAYSGSGPAAGATGSKIVGFNLSGNYGNNLSVTSATTPPIDCRNTSSLALRFKRWLRTKQNDPVTVQASTDGINWEILWSSSSAVSDFGWREVQYALPAAFAGNSSVRLRWTLASNQSQNEIGWNLDDVELIGETTPDTAPPVPSLNVAALTTADALSNACRVTYTDATAVRLSSLDSTDLVVTGPSGYSNLVEFVGADLPADGSPVTALYSIAGPGGAWNAEDNGTYTLTLLKDAVQDTVNNATPQTVLGTFSVSITEVPSGVLGVAPAGDLNITGTVGGPFSPVSQVYTLTNAGGSALTWTLSKNADWLTLSAATGELSPGQSTNVTVSLNSQAESLTVGEHTDTIGFANLTTGAGDAQRTVTLQIAPIVVSISTAAPGTGRFLLSFQGQPSRAYIIQVSSDLMQWNTAATVIAGANGTVTYEDPASDTVANRFYRVMLAQ